MQETLVWSVGWEDPLEEGMATHSSICLENPMDRGACWTTVHVVAKSWTRLSDQVHFIHITPDPRVVDCICCYSNIWLLCTVTLLLPYQVKWISPPAFISVGSVTALTKRIRQKWHRASCRTQAGEPSRLHFLSLEHLLEASHYIMKCDHHAARSPSSMQRPWSRQSAIYGSQVQPSPPPVL